MISKSTLWLILIFSISFIRVGAQNDILFTLSNSPYYIVEDLVLEESASLTIEPGVIIYLDSMVNISLSGNLIAEGTEENPIQFLTNSNYKWGVLEVKPNASMVSLKHTTFVDGRLKFNCQNVFIDNMDYSYNYRTFFGEQLLLIKNAETYISNCNVSGYSNGNNQNTGDGILISNATSPIITKSNFTSTSDAIEFINCSGGEISSCFFEDMNDDAIDLNHCQNILISNNEIRDVNDRAMEIGSENFGPSLNITILRNIIYSCAEGISIRQGSNGKIENNTLYENQSAINIIKDDGSEDGSSAQIINTLFNNNVEDIFTDEYSTSSIKNCITDNSPIPGENNITGDALFIDPEEYDFHLDSLSPCIDSGYKLSPLDPDNTIADIGALYRHQDIGYFLNDDLNVFPNPFTDKVIIQLASPADYVTIEIYNLNGQSVYFREYSTLSLYIQIDLSYLDAGSYTFKIYQDQSTLEYHKVIKL